MAVLTGALCFLALLGVSCAGPSAAARASVMAVDIEHSRFIPSTLEVEAGSTVTFVVRNGDPIDHEFLIGDEEVQAIHEKGTEAHHGARPGEVSVPAGATVRTTYTFAEPGTLLFGCHLPQHYDFGMKGVIRITG